MVEFNKVRLGIIGVFPRVEYAAVVFKTFFPIMLALY